MLLATAFSTVALLPGLLTSTVSDVKQDSPVPILLLLWICYLSLSVAGQTFLWFQWDGLLLETGLLAVL